MLIWCNVTKINQENAFVTIISSQIRFLQCLTAKLFSLGSIPHNVLSIKGNRLVINYEEKVIFLQTKRDLKFIYSF